ncbi:MAG: tRNA lysidine(34) synthetase TilS [Paludibacteraceae bacterium]
METLKKVREFILSNQLLQPGERVLVGVSGGIDSVVLLNILLKSGYECIVAHCNFHLRGSESDRDEKFVENLAKDYGILYKKIDFDTINYARSNKISIEMAARELRYGWFNKMAKETGATSIIVAHHSDDSIETFILNLVRGTGLKGLTGIDPQFRNIIRPLLCCSRQEIDAYAKANDLKSVFDSTNASNDYNRNKIRNQVLPVLSGINPSVRQTLAEDIIRIKGAWKIFNEKIHEIKEKIVLQDEKNIYVSIPELKKQADVNTVLYEILNPYNFNNDVIEDIVMSLDNTSGSTFTSPTHCLLKDRNTLIINEIETKNELEYKITEGINELTEPVHLIFKFMTNFPEFQVSKSPDTIHVDANKLKFPLTIRKWHNGDVFQPFGMEQNKKISDFFINSKLNRFQKDNVWILLSEDKIVWIVGLRTDNRFRITEKTQNIVEISFKD